MYPNNLNSAFHYAQELNLLPIKCECILSNGTILNTSVSTLDFIHELYYFESVSAKDEESKRKLLVLLIKKYISYLSSVLNIKYLSGNTNTNIRLYDGHDLISLNKNDIISICIKDIFIILNKVSEVCKEDSELEPIYYNSDINF